MSRQLFPRCEWTSGEADSGLATFWVASDRSFSFELPSIAHFHTINQMAHAIADNAAADARRELAWRVQQAMAQ